MREVVVARSAAEIEWEVVTSRAGEPTLKLGGRFVHSEYAPQREAEGLAERVAAELRERKAELFVQIGAGLGYFNRALAQHSQVPVLLWDPFPEVSRAVGAAMGTALGIAETVKGAAPHSVAGVVERVAPQTWGERVRLVHDAEALDAALKESPGARRPHLWVHPGYQELARFPSRYALRALQRERPKLCADAAIVSRRALDFLVRFPFLHTLQNLEGCLRGHTAILVSPGPSLAAALPALRARRGGVLIAAVQALKPLAEAGVKVDFVVAPDPGEYARYLEGFEPEFCALLADTSVKPEFLDRWPEKTFLFQLRTPHLQQVAWEKCELPFLDEPFISVSETSLVLAHQLGARRFILLGMDFAFEETRYKRLHFRAAGSDGNLVLTNFHYFHAAQYLSWLCPKLRAGGCEIFRLSPGLPVRGVQAIDAEKLEPLLAPAPVFELPEFRASATWQERAQAARSVLRAARRHSSVSHAPTSLDPEESAPRFKDLRPLDAAERERALQDAERELGERWKQRAGSEGLR